MTREEAARILEKQFDKSCGNYRYQNKDQLDYEDALWMAIHALRKLDEQENAKTPCDLCCYNPPSSRDGKPCTMCPASPVETNMQNGCDFARQLGFSGCTKCPIDCDVRQAQKEESK